MTQVPSLSLNGTDYPLDSLSSAARVQVANIKAVDREIAHLKQQLAIAETARNAYLSVLVSAVEAPAVSSGSGTAAKKTSKPRTKKD